MTTKTEANLKDNAPDGIALSDAEMKTARKDGAKEDVKEAAKDTHRSLTDGVQPGEAPTQKWHGSDEIQLYAHIIEQGIDQFEKTIANTKDGAVSEEKVYGLLALERNGPNRTPYVKAMIKRLGIKKDELPGGGPSYTNDITAITEL